MLISWDCSIVNLRRLNVVFLIGILIISHRLFSYLHGKNHSFVLWLNSVQIAQFPLIFFFSLLFYTDLGSLFFVLLTYYLALRRFYKLSALSGVVAMLFRQTNVIWICFTLGISVIYELKLIYSLMRYTTLAKLFELSNSASTLSGN